MNERQRRFADEYIRTGNIFQSAINAGYSENYAKTRVGELLDNDRIKSYIDERLSVVDKKAVADIEEVMTFYTQVVRGELTEESVASTPLGVQKVNKIPDINDRVRAANELMKRLTAGNREVLQNQLLEAQIKKLLKEIETETTVEDKMQEYFDKLDDVIIDE